MTETSGKIIYIRLPGLCNFFYFLLSPVDKILDELIIFRVVALLKYKYVEYCCYIYPSITRFVLVDLQYWDFNVQNALFLTDIQDYLQVLSTITLHLSVIPCQN